MTKPRSALYSRQLGLLDRLSAQHRARDSSVFGVGASLHAPDAANGALPPPAQADSPARTKTSAAAGATRRIISTKADTDHLRSSCLPSMTDIARPAECWRDAAGG